MSKPIDDPENNDQHQEARARDSCEQGEEEQHRRDPPLLVACFLDEVDSERDEHHDGGAERNRMLRGRIRARSAPACCCRQIIRRQRDHAEP